MSSTSCAPKGFSDFVLDGDVKENEMLELYADMDKRRGVMFGREWKNSFGMRFLPLGDILMAVWETRRRSSWISSRPLAPDGL